MNWTVKIRTRNSAEEFMDGDQHTTSITGIFYSFLKLVLSKKIDYYIDKICLI